MYIDEINAQLRHLFQNKSGTHRPLHNNPENLENPMLVFLLSSLARKNAY